MTSLAPHAPPIRFRRRLALAFVVVVGITSAILVVGCYLTVSHQRHEIFLKRAISQAKIIISVANENGGTVQLEDVNKIAREFTGFDIIVVSDQVVSTNPAIRESDIPERLRDVTELKTAQTQLNGVSYRVVASPLSSTSSTRMFVWFSEENVLLSLIDLRNVLAVGWFLVTVLSFFAGRSIAVRTLAPIHLAAESARLRVEGLLHTTLPANSSDEFRAWSNYFDDIAVALEDKLAELQAAHERERRFTSDVAHDLRTPLAAMVSASSILCEYLDDMPEGARRPTELIVNDVKRMRRLVTDILEIGRLDARSEPPRIEIIDVEEFINGVVRAESSIDVSIDGEPRIQSDRARLERILSNLVANALIHGGQEVSVTSKTSAGRFIVDVCDRGPGIPEDQLPYIFDRFHKAEASRSTEGSGLGLAIASQHARVLGGTVTARNRESGGACFRLDVPIAPNAG